MNVIEVKHLSKEFRIKQKQKGFIGGIKSIVKPKIKLKKAEIFWYNITNEYTNNNFSIDHVGKYERAILKFNN